MLGAEGSLTGYDEFVSMLQKSLETDAGTIESLWIYTVDLFRIWGVPMFVGSIPWAIIASWLSYRWSLRLVNRFRRRHKKVATRPEMRQ